MMYITNGMIIHYLIVLAFGVIGVALYINTTPILIFLCMALGYIVSSITYIAMTKWKFSSSWWNDYVTLST